MVVYESKMYAGIITGYNTAPENTTLENYPDGEPVTVVLQDKDTNSYTDYQ